MQYFANFDFESQLEKNKYDINYSKKNEEFEYLFFWTSPQGELLTRKKYKQDYLDFITSLTKKKCQYSSHNLDSSKKPILWWGQPSQIAKEVQSKVKSALFGIKNELVHSSTKICENFSELSYELVKLPFSVSGNGHYLLGQHDNKIKNALEYSQCINEKILQRKKDFSILFDKGKITAINENVIDRQFQFKGAWLENNEELYDEKYNIILSYISALGYTGEGSIDSFSYIENGEQSTYYLSEINARKTMGIIGRQLQSQFFPNQLAKMGIVRRKINMTLKQRQELSKEGILILSPNDNFFHFFLISGNSREEILEKEKLALTLL